MQSSSDRSNFGRGLDILRRRGFWLVLCGALAGAAAFGLSRHQVKKYTATASLVFKSNQLTQQIAGLPSNVPVQAQQNSDVKFVQIGDMAEKTASRLGHGLTEQEVRKSLSIAQLGETNIVGESSIVDVSASVTSPALAAQIANTYAERFVAEQQTSNRRFFSSALATVSKQLAALSPKQRLRPAGIALQNRAQELKTLAELQYGGVQLAQRAVVPTSPSSPKTLRNTLIGGVMGLLLGLGLVLLLERLDRRIREPEELETIYRAPLLGVVPRDASPSRSAGATADGPRVPAPVAAEAFGLILAHMRSFNSERDVRTVLITAAEPGEGTTTVSLHLAEAAARSGSCTLLVEMDFRRPTLAQHLQIHPGPGLRDVLTGAVPAGSAVQSIELPTAAGSDGITRSTLDVLTAGVAQSAVLGELFNNHAVETVLDQTRAIYDLLIIDTSSLLAVSDAFPVLRRVDGVVVVSRIGHDRRDTAERLHQVLDRSAVPLLGVVANRFNAKRRGSTASAHSQVEQSTTPAENMSNGAVSTQEPRPMTRI